MTRLALLALGLVMGCGSSLPGVDGGGGGGTSGGGTGGVGGASGVGGGGGSTGGTGGAGGGSAPCSGSREFTCIVGSCSNDVASEPPCIEGTWRCPAGTIDSRLCEGVAGRGGAGGGHAGSGGAGGKGGSGGGGRGGTGAGGRGGAGGTFGNESCSNVGLSCASPGFCCGGLVCLSNVCVPTPNTDAGGDAPACTGTAVFCIQTSCSNDIQGPRAVCQNGAWTCPSGYVSEDSCHGCIGNPAPNYVCGDGGWVWVPPDGGRG